MVLCAMFVVLITIGAFIKIPVPVVPFTLQYLFTMLAGLLLGAKMGLTSVLVYIFWGEQDFLYLHREGASDIFCNQALGISLDLQ